MKAAASLRGGRKWSVEGERSGLAQVVHKDIEVAELPEDLVANPIE
jgi:hypothetical protein